MACREFLLRAGKSPFDHIPPAKVYWDDLIARNSGNLLFAHSAYKTLSAPGAEIDVTRYRNPDPGEADAINEKYDRFVIPLANAFRPDFESQLKSLTALITRLKIPCVVVGVGAQADIDASPERRGKLDASVKAFVSAVLDKSHSIGVRGEFTAAYLKALGFGAVTVIGCPSMFLHGEKIAVTKRVGQLDASARIAVNLTRGMPENIAPLYRAIFSDRADAVYVAQNRSDLAMLLWGLGQGRTGKEDLLPADVAHPVVRSGRSQFFTDVPTWLDFLRARDFSFGTRIHGNVFAILAGTPAYVIAHDSRTLELARYFDIPHRRIEAVTEKTTVEELYAEADYRALHANHPRRFETYRRFLENNGIDHIFAHAGAADAFEERLASTVLPEPVTFAGAADREDLLSRLTELASESSRKTSELAAKLAAEIEKASTGAPAAGREAKDRAAPRRQKKRWWRI